MAFTPEDERRFLEAASPGALAAKALDERLRALPRRTRVDIYRRANAGEDLVRLVEEAELTFVAIEEKSIDRRDGFRIHFPIRPPVKP